MERQTPVSSVMTTAVLTFSPETSVSDAMSELVERGIDAAPVVAADGAVVGMISTRDLIVQDVELHVPTVISMFGATIELPGTHKRFEEDLRKHLGSTVGEVMSDEPVTISPDATIEDAAGELHRHDISRMPVVGPEGLVGIISRTDVLRAIMADDARAPEA